MEQENQETYIDSLYDADTVLAEVKESIRQAGMPEISIATGYGRLLTLLVAASGAERVLEIGALGGYSGICLARGLSEGGKLICLERVPAYAQLASENVKHAGFGGKVEYMVGDAVESLQQLDERGEKFDFFFIDADKGNYLVYLDYALKLGKPGAIIVADNVFLGGRTLNPSAQGESPKAIREYNRRIAADPALQSTIIPAYDGLSIARIL